MKKDLALLVLLILPSFTWLLQPGFYPMHDDLQAMRQLEMNKCFHDGQIPCRWVSDLGFGFGYPLFNYYPPLPYLIGAPMHLLNIQYIDIVKIVGILGFMLCALNMYLLGKEFFGRRGGLISSLFYTYAPYHAVDFWVRGAVNEFYAMAFYPAIFLTLYLLIKTGNSKYIKWSALSIAGLMLSHNLMLLIFFPVAIIWSVFWLVKFRKLNNLITLINLITSGLWSLGISAFFTLPVIFESKYAHIETLTMGYFNYLAHFLNVRQIFLFPNWGYGSSELGPNDGMSFFLGYLHWIVPLTLILLSLFIKKLRMFRSMLYLLLLILIWSLIMTHNKSTLIWDNFLPLQSLQFPWRFLTISVFSASFLSGALALLPKSKLLLLTSFTLLFLLNANYFRPSTWLPNMTDSQKFSGKSWQYQITSGIFDYLPIFAKAPPADAAGSDLDIISGIGEYRTLFKNSRLQKYSLSITSSSAIAELQTYYFPGWQAYLNGQKQIIDSTRDPLLGRIQVDLPKGSSDLILKFNNTPIRTISNLLSLISWVCFIIILWIQRPKKNLT